MLNLFFVIGNSVYWEFKQTEYFSKLRNSMNVPIFAVCYSEFCPICKEIPDLVKEYTEGKGKREDVIITMLECTNHPYLCKNFHTMGFPHIVLVMGNDYRRWPRVYDRDIDKWDEFINKYLYPEIKNNSESNLHFDAGSQYVITTPSLNSSYYRSIQEKYKQYRLMNVDFYYEINESITEPIITVYRSKTTSEVFDSKKESLDSFIDRTRFPMLHEFTFHEFEEISNYPYYLYHVEGKITDIEKTFLANLSTIHGQNMIVGWTSDVVIARRHFLESKDIPISIYKSKKCTARSKYRIVDLDKIDFFNQTDKGVACQYEFWSGLKNNNGIRGYTFQYYFLSICMLIILISRIKTIIPEEMIKFN